MVSHDLFAGAASVLVEVNKMRNRAAPRRTKVPAEAIETEQASNCGESNERLVAGPLAGVAIFDR